MGRTKSRVSSARPSLPSGNGADLDGYALKSEVLGAARSRPGSSVTTNCCGINGKDYYPCGAAVWHDAPPARQFPSPLWLLSRKKAKAGTANSCTSDNGT